MDLGTSCFLQLRNCAWFLCFPLCGWPPSLWSKANLGNAGDRLTQWLNHSPIVWLEHVQTQAPGFPCHLDKLHAAQFFEVLRMRSNESKYKMDSIWFYNIYICIYIYMCVCTYVCIHTYVYTISYLKTRSQCFVLSLVVSLTCASAARYRLCSSEHHWPSLTA